MSLAHSGQFAGVVFLPSCGFWGGAQVEVLRHLTSPLLSFLLAFLISTAKPAGGLEHPCCPLKESGLIGNRS